MFARSSAHPPLVVTLFASLTALAACTDGADDDLGAAELTIAQVPLDVQCIHVDAHGASGDVGTSIDVTVSDQPITMALGALPTGLVQFAGAAYDAPCPDAVTAPAGAPTWVALPITAQLFPGVPQQLDFEFRRNLPGTGTADFQDAAIGVAQGDYTTLALMADGSLRGWGKSYFGELGVGGQVVAQPSPGPVATELRDLVGVAATTWRTCAWDEHQLWCWGANFAGAIGDGTDTMRLTPTPVPGPWSAIADVQLGQSSSCLLDRDGRLFCWGGNGVGQVGLPTTTTTVPVPTLQARRYEAVALGAAFTCGLTATGGVDCWGTNAQGQLGNQTTQPQSSTPIAVSVRATVDLAAGLAHACAARADGTVWCWGANTAGQLGNGTTVASAAPVQVVGLTDAVAIDAGREVTCALRRDTTVACWGAGAAGQLGNGTGLASSTPVAVPNLTGVVALAAGDAAMTMCATLSDGEVQCWGAGSSGQIGDGRTANRYVPTKVDF